MLPYNTCSFNAALPKHKRTRKRWCDGTKEVWSDEGIDVHCIVFADKPWIAAHPIPSAGGQAFKHFSNGTRDDLPGALSSSPYALTLYSTIQSLPPKPGLESLHYKPQSQP